MGYFMSYPGFLEWYMDFYRLNCNIFLDYYFIISLLLVFFLAGSLLGSRLRIKINMPNFKIGKIATFVFGLVFFSAIVFFIFQSDADFFSGYESYNTDFLGKAATFLVIGCFLTIYFLEIGIGIISIFPILASLLLCVVIMLGLGARIYFLLFVISFLMYSIKYRNLKISIKYIALIALIFLIFLIIGVLRVGLDLNFENLMYILFAEPMFTWWSAQTYILNNDLFSLIGDPAGYVTSFYNFIPSFIFENKSNYIINISDYANFSSPLGATSLIVSLLGNFGIVLSMIYIFVVGFFCSQLSIFSEKSSFLKVYYILICSLLPFQFFRDGFEILNKQIYWNMLIVPSILLLIICGLSLILKYPIASRK
jgi:hypothetical protein